MDGVTGTTVSGDPQQQHRSIRTRIADELGARPDQVQAAVDLLDEGSTVPFVARYRKEATGGLDDAQLRTLEERLRYLRELEERRAAVLDSIRTQGKLDDELEARIWAAESKARLEDIYLPFKPKRRTKAMIAREQGLEPLADALLGDPTLDPVGTAQDYVTDEVLDSGAALEGARSILVERMGENADLVGGLRERMWTHGRLVTKVREGKENDQAAAKFSDYFEYSEKFTTLPSHRILAVFRGETEEALDVTLDPGDEDQPTAYERAIAAEYGIADAGRCGRRVAARRRALGVAHPDGDGAGHRHPGPAARRGRGGRDRRVRGQPARPAARRPGRHPLHDGAGPGPAHRRQGRRRRRHRQGRGHGGDLPARAAQRQGRRH